MAQKCAHGRREAGWVLGGGERKVKRRVVLWTNMGTFLIANKRDVLDKMAFTGNLNLHPHTATSRWIFLSLCSPTPTPRESLLKEKRPICRVSCEECSVWTRDDRHWMNYMLGDPALSSQYLRGLTVPEHPGPALLGCYARRNFRLDSTLNLIIWKTIKATTITMRRFQRKHL